MMLHRPRKRFGQNFLHDENIISKILHELNPGNEDVLVEIGPGLGALTAPIIARGFALHAIEIDRDVVARLKLDFSSTQLTIHNADALAFDFSGLGNRLRVFGNLPYNISTPLLFHLTDFAENLLDLHLMLQKEVVERIVAKPSTPAYGRLSVMLQFRFEVEHLFDVSPNCFHPVPKVYSSFLRLSPKQNIDLSSQRYNLLSRIVMNAFGQRRKMLRNTLSSFLDSQDFEALALDPKARAENLSLNQYLAIVNHLQQKKPVRN
jgi:16S rRNA (adenine1518-N6/adenine1519-N6)-dimethyltransferase